MSKPYLHVIPYILTHINIGFDEDFFLFQNDFGRGIESDLES
jgi:hypothetical protein